MTTRSALSLAILSLVAAPMVGQAGPVTTILVPSCPAADSILGPPASKRPLTLRGSAFPRGEVRIILGASGGSVPYGVPTVDITVAAYPAPLSRAPLPAELLLTLTGTPATQLNSAVPPIAATLRFKTDTVGILGTIPTVEGTPAPGMAMAFVSFPLRPDLVARIVAEKDARLELGRTKVDLPKGLRRQLGDAYRGALCGYQPAQ